MNNKLITALRATASALENIAFTYDWTRRNQCNCGALYCALTGMSASELNNHTSGKFPEYAKEYKSTHATWTTLAGYYCPIAGIPTNEVFKELYSFGLTAKEIGDLEYLADEEVIARVNASRKAESRPLTRLQKFINIFRRNSQATTPELDQKNVDDVVAYMRAWADILTEKGQPDRPDGATSSNQTIHDETNTIPG